MENITICYLSWKRNDIFDQTLKSHLENGLFDLILPENRLIFFQEISDQDKQLAEKYNCKFIGNKFNVGILNAFVELIENCKTEYFIFCENDWNLIENKETTFKVLQDSIKLCENDIIVRLRSIKNPGIPLYSRPENIESWLLQDISNFPYKLESLSWINEPEKYYKTLEKVQLNTKWYICTLEHQKWSNNIFICKTSILKNTINELKEYKNLDNYTGLEDTLINKIKLNLKIAGGDGLFTHLDKIK
jgi:hypothetical protein